MPDLDGKVVALICRGSDVDRAIAVALAEAGADIAMATISRQQTEEFSTASIANEVWAMGRDQFNTIMDAADPVAAQSFAEEVCDRLGRCDAVVIAPGPTPFVEFDELSRDEWEPMVSGSLTAPVFASQAFARVLERAGGGTVVVVDDGSSHENVAGSILSESLRSLGAHLGIVWRNRTLRCLVISREGAPDRIVAALS